MKKTIILAFAALMMAFNASAQSYTNSKYYNPATGRLDYSRQSSFFKSDFAPNGMYYGFRLGPAFSTISSDDNSTKASESRTGINIGAVIGSVLTDEAPLYIESGLFYTRKGGNAKLEGNNLQYSLDYLVLPVVFKYDAELVDNFSIQPFLGLYGALGVGGRVKDYGKRESYSSFDGDFNRFDGGLRMGCGLNFSPFYVELTYDLGLTNDLKDDFDAAHTRSFQLNFGVNF